MNNIKIAIDPGAKGAIAFINEDNVIQTINMPDTMPEISDTLRSLKTQLDPSATCIIENVGGYMPGNSGPAACKFARHCGHLEAILYTLGIPTQQVAPTTWQKKLGTLPKEKKERKNKIKDLMARAYPHLKITLTNADAIAILHTAI